MCLFIHAAGKNVGFEGCTEGITTEVTGRFFYVRIGEIYIFIFKTCLLELSTMPLLSVESSSVPSGRYSALNPI